MEAKIKKSKFALAQENVEIRSALDQSAAKIADLETERIRALEMLGEVEETNELATKRIALTLIDNEILKAVIAGQNKKIEILARGQFQVNNHEV